MKQLLTTLAGQFVGYAIACVYPVLALAGAVPWSWLTCVLVFTLLGVAGTVGGFVTASRRDAPPRRNAGTRAVLGLLGALLGVIIVSNLAVSVAAAISVISGSGTDGFERLWEDYLVWLTLVVGLPGGYLVGRR